MGRHPITDRQDVDTFVVTESVVQAVRDLTRRNLDVIAVLGVVTFVVVSGVAASLPEGAVEAWLALGLFFWLLGWAVAYAVFRGPVLQGAVRRFEGRFPSARQRATAMSVLAGFADRNRTARRLHRALLAQPPRTEDAPTEDVVQVVMESAQPSEPPAPAPVVQDSALVSEPKTGEYPYIPLEPFKESDDRESRLHPGAAQGSLLNFHCGCGARLSAPTAQRGRQGRCPKCGRILTVPKEP